MGAVLLALAAIALVSPGAASAADPAQDALAVRDAYVSPRALGPAARAEEANLARVAARMAAEGRHVKLAIVLGPVGARNLQAYARTLAGRLAFGGTLVVTTPGGAAAAAGPRTAADITRALRAAGVRAIANPTERVTVAASVAAPPGFDPDESAPAPSPHPHLDRAAGGAVGHGARLRPQRAAHPPGGGRRPGPTRACRTPCAPGRRP